MTDDDDDDDIIISVLQQLFYGIIMGICSG
jgi:hypothetical protein